MSMILNVEAVSKKELSKNGRDFTVYNLKADGEWYGLGYNPPVEGVARGAQVEAEVTTNSRGYKDAKIIRLVAAGSHDSPVTSDTSPAKPAPASKGKSTYRQFGDKGGFPVHPLSYERTLGRRNALEVAAAFCAAKAAAGAKKEIADMTPEQLVEMASVFEVYSCGDKEREKIAEARKLREAAAKQKEEEEKRMREELERKMQEEREQANPVTDADDDLDWDDDDDVAF